VSSIYRVLCLGHDPAITTGAEYSEPVAAVATIANGIDGHQGCDLLIGRYSYPLVEVGCPPATGSERSGQRRCYSHSTTEWVDVAWLRILAAVHQSGAENMRALAGVARLAHWSPERLQRLRYELGIDADEPAEQAGAFR
jgi:hypothetical protein